MTDLKPLPIHQRQKKSRKQTALETLRICVMIAIMATGLIGMGSFILGGLKPMLGFGSTQLNSGAHSISRSICAGLGNNIQPETNRLGLSGLIGMPFEQWPIHLGNLLWSRSAEDCAKTYDPSYAAFLHMVEASAQTARQQLSLAPANLPVSPDKALSQQLQNLPPAWQAFGRWSMMRGYQLLLEPAQDLSNTMSTAASIGSELLGVNDILSVANIDGMVQNLGAEELAANIKGELNSKVAGLTGPADPMRGIRLLAMPSLQLSQATAPLEGYIAALPYSLPNGQGQQEQIWLVMHIIAPNPKQPNQLTVLHWVTRPLR